MAGVRIDSGPLSPTYKFSDVPKERWKQLVREKRNFIATNINYDCRCLVEFCEEAEVVWSELGYESAADMIRNGYELEPVEIELAVAWLRHNGTDKAVGIDTIKQKVAEARENKESQQGKRNTSLNFKEVKPNSNEATLRRLARDAPELLDKIEAGELSVNAAAIQAGIRKKATPEDVCLKAFAKVEDRVAVARSILASLTDDERAQL